MPIHIHNEGSSIKDVHIFSDIFYSSLPLVNKKVYFWQAPSPQFVNSKFQFLRVRNFYLYFSQIFAIVFFNFSLRVLWCDPVFLSRSMILFKNCRTYHLATFEICTQNTCLLFYSLEIVVRCKCKMQIQHSRRDVFGANTNMNIAFGFQKCLFFIET